MTLQEEHAALKASGMFWEFFPELSGDWEKDRAAFENFRQQYPIHETNT